MIPKIIHEFKAKLTKHFPINLFVIDKTGLIVDADDNMLQLSDVPDISKVKGTHVRRFSEKAWKTTLEVLKTRKTMTLYEKHEGKIFLVIKAPYKQGCFRGVLGTSIDITKLEESRQAKREFIMNMNHDIRTPFAGIITVLETLAEDETDSKKKYLMDLALAASTRLLNFMLDINQISEAGHLPLTYEIFNIKQMADEVLIFLHPTFLSKGLVFINNCKVNWVISNSFRIKQILLNLLANAVKFTPKGSIKLTITKASNDLLIKVQDTGIGIDKSHHAMIFEEFYKVKPSYQSNDYVGVGKGLYLVKKYLEELHGKIIVQSAANEGSTFIAEVPLEQKQK